MVTYGATATDLVDGNVAVVFAPHSGSLFPIGTWTGLATTTDSHGNSASATFTVIVKGAPEQIADLIGYVPTCYGWCTLDKGLTTSLTSQLRATQRDLQSGATAQACEDAATFIAHVRAQSGKKIPAEWAGVFIDDALRIRAVLGC